MDIDALKVEISYDPETGEFRWLKPASGRRLSGRAGTMQDGYRRVMVNGQAYQCHVLAFAFMMNRWPENEIDHVNGDKADNRWSNLREATRQENAENVHRPRRHNKLGLLGVCLGPKLVDGSQRYIAQIQLNGRRIYIGQFASAEEAHEAYLSKKRELHRFNTL